MTMKMRVPNYEELGVIAQQLETVGHVSIPKMAKLLDLHHQTLHAYVRDGKILTLQVGSRKHISRDEYIRYRQSKVKQTP